MRLFAVLTCLCAATAISCGGSASPPPEAESDEVPPPVQFTADEVEDRSPTWSPDGAWIAYGSHRGGHWHVWKKSRDGGEIVQLTSGPDDDHYPMWSPDGTRLSFVSNRGGATNVWTVAADGTDLRRVTADTDSTAWHPYAGGGSLTSWSPDSRYIAFTSVRSGNADIWALPASGGTARQVTTDPAEDVTPGWSPDGKTIAFASERSGNQDIWTVPASGGIARQVTFHLARDFNTNWSPDGQWLAFTSERGGNYQTWVVPSDGGTAQCVSGLINQDSYVPRWSPDGRLIATNAHYRANEILEVPLAGGPPRILASDPSIVLGLGSPCWSPDGEHVAYLALAPEGYEGYDVWRVPVAGGDPVPVTAGAQAAGDHRGGVAWSPDGRTIAFVSVRDDQRAIWTVPAEGGTPRRVSFTGGMVGLPDWSPDGTHLVFTSNPDGNGDVFVVPAARGETRQVTDWPTRDWGATWSPDGRRLAFVSDRLPPRASVSEDESGVGIWTMPAEGGEPTWLAAGISPHWSPDGRSLVYNGPAGARDGNWHLATIPAAGGQPTRVGPEDLDGPAWPTWSPDGSRILLARYHVLVQSNIYITDVSSLIDRR